MSLKALSDYTAVSKYAKWIKEDKRRETWSDTVCRSKEMMMERFDDHEDIEEEYKYVANKDVLGSQRCMQFGGKPIIQHNTRMFNCAASYCDRIAFFQEYFYILLCGTGAGFSVQLQHIDKLPNFTRKRRNGTVLPTKKYLIEDSIEGWANAAGVLLSSYFENPTFADYYNSNVEFDYSDIRRKGSPLSFGIGKAPGPTPLRQALDKVKNKLDKTIEKKARRLWSVNAYDIAMYLADSVISGGVRRSATIALFSLQDDLMMKAKVGNWYHKYPHRARSNNTVMLLRGATSWEEYSKIFDNTKQFGEPGFIWVDDLEAVSNPCAEIQFDTKIYVKRNSKELKNFLKEYIGPLYDKGTDELGLSGWGFCNLTTINGSTCKTVEEFYKRCEIAARLGTRQATFTNMPYLGAVTKAIIEKEALLGVAIGGMMRSPEILLNPEVLKNGAEIVKRENEGRAKKYGINPGARLNCVKPDGNSSCLMESDPGIIPSHGPRYFRNVQVNKQEHIYQFFKELNPEACEESKWSSGNTDDIIRFPVEIKDKSVLFKNDVSAERLLDYVKTTYVNWVLPGTVRERGVSDKITHNVSNTIHVKDDEWDIVKKKLYEEREFFGGVSFIAYKGDLDYNQAPYTIVHSKDEIIEKYEVTDNQFKFLTELVVTSQDLWDDCDVLLGYKTKDYVGFLERAKQFLSYEFGLKEVKWFTYLLKDVWLCQKWDKVVGNWKEVDYTQMKEDVSDIKFEQEISCAGGACQL